MSLIFFFFFNQKTAYEMRISDWSSDVCSSDLLERELYEWRIRLLPSPLWRGWRLPQHARRSRRSFHRPRRPRRRRLRLLRKHQSPAPRFRGPWPTSWKRDPKSVVLGKGGAVGVELGGRRINKKKSKNAKNS